MSRQTFSDEYIATELRHVFGSPDEYCGLRAGLAELRSVLGDEKSIDAESALQPYLDKRWEVGKCGKEVTRKTKERTAGELKSSP